jgi:hypothetical protein
MTFGATFVAMIRTSKYVVSALVAFVLENTIKRSFCCAIGATTNITRSALIRRLKQFLRRSGSVPIAHNPKKNVLVELHQEWKHGASGSLRDPVELVSTRPVLLARKPREQSIERIIKISQEIHPEDFCHRGQAGVVARLRRHQHRSSLESGGGLQRRIKPLGLNEKL